MTKYILSIHLILSFAWIVYGQNANETQNFELWKQCDQKIYLRPNIFHVNGQATKSAKPTVGIVVLGISISDPEASIALQKANTQLSNALTAIKAAMTSNSNTTFSTSQLSIQPQYNYTQNPITNLSQNILEGYTVTNTLTVRTKDLSLIGTIIDKGVYSGLNNVESVSFQLESQEQQNLQESLLTDAVRDSMARAILSLSDVGYKIVSIQSVTIIEQPVYNYHAPMFMAEASAMGGGATTQVFAKDQDVTANVQVGFVIEPAQALITK